MFSNFFSNSNQKVSEPEIIEEQDSFNDISENENEEYVENEEKYEDSEDEDEDEEEDEDEDEEDIDNLEAMLRLQYEGALDEVEKWKKKAKKWEKKYDKQKVSNKKLKEELDESRFSIETIDGKIRYKSLEEIKCLTVYDDQRPINKKHVQDIKNYQLQYYDTYNNTLHDCLPFIVAIQPDGMPSFINKSGKRTNKILIDGQHRLQALNQILNEAGDDYKKMSKLRFTIRYIECDDMDEVHQEFITINKGLPLTKNDLDKNKRLYSVSEELVNFIERLEEHKLFDSKTARKQRRRCYLYIKVLKDRINENQTFSDLMHSQHIKSKELMEAFLNFNNEIFIQSSLLDFEKFRKKIKAKPLLTKALDNLKTKLSMFSATRDEKHVTNIITYIYYKKYDQLVNDFLKSLKQHYGFENYDSDEESEEEEIEI
jgi:hypothetical protein